MNASIDTWDNQLVSVKGYSITMFDRMIVFNYLDFDCCMIAYNHIYTENACNVSCSVRGHGFKKVL